MASCNNHAIVNRLPSAASGAVSCVHAGCYWDRTWHCEAQCSASRKMKHGTVDLTKGFADISRGSQVGGQQLSARPLRLPRLSRRHAAVLAYRSRGREGAEVTSAVSRQQQSKASGKQALLESVRPEQGSSGRSVKQEQLPLLIASNVASFRRRSRRASPEAERAMKDRRQKALQQVCQFLVHGFSDSACHPSACR
jgi:hypothetical protein